MLYWSIVIRHLQELLEARSLQADEMVGTKGIFWPTGDFKGLQHKLISTVKAKILPKDSDIRHFAVETSLNFARAMFDNAAGAKEGKDIECVHDMRVASRRLREAFQLFKAFLPHKKLKKTLSKVKKITRTLGMPREMDVNVSLLQNSKPKSVPLALATHEYLLEIFEFEQANVRRKMLKAFDKIDLKAAESELMSLAQTPRVPSGETHLLVQPHQPSEMEVFLEHANVLFKEKTQVVADLHFDSARPQSDEELHRLRITLKKLRYDLEICNPLYESCFDRTIALAKNLQEILGKIHDYCVLIQRLKAHQDYLHQKSRSRLVRGCQRVIAGLEETKESLYPSISPAYSSLLEEMTSKVQVQSDEVQQISHFQAVVAQ